MAPGAASVILGFHTKQLTERGTEVALLDYARGARDVLGHEVRVFVPARSERTVPEVKRAVEDEFELVFYDHPRAIACDALYVIKRGFPGRITDTTPELNHAFVEPSHPHGHRFAVVSEWVAGRARRELPLGRGRVLRLPRLRKPPVVPHIVALPDVDEDLREELAIPADAVVVGRHGGEGTFALDFVRRAVCDALEQRDDLWFVFLNTNRFHAHERIVHLPRTIDRAEVRRFVNTCDYALNASVYGETFGLAVAENALAGVPVLTYLGTPLLGHLELLQDGLLLGYSSYEEVLRYLTTLPRRTAAVPSDVGVRYGVERVMGRFDEVFLR